MPNKLLGRADAETMGKYALEKSQSGLFWNFNKNASYGYFVLASDLNQTEDQILATSGLPAHGSILNNAIVRSGSAKDLGRVQLNGTARTLWLVTIETDSRLDPGNIDPDPTNLIPKRRWYTEKENERVEVDINNVILETPALEPLNLEMPMVNLVLEIERYEPYPVNPATMFAFVNHTNQGTFYGAPIGTALIDEIQSDEEFISNAVFLKTRYVIKFKLRWDDNLSDFKENTYHNKEILLQGYQYRPTAGAEPRTFVGPNGHPKKVNLKNDGTIETGSTPHFDTWELIPYADFSTLNLEF